MFDNIFFLRVVTLCMYFIKFLYGSVYQGIHAQEERMVCSHTRYKLATFITNDQNCFFDK